eukprot:g5450.t1
MLLRALARSSSTLRKARSAGCSSIGNARSQHVLCERSESDPRVLKITLNDPKKLNALNADMGDEFSHIVSVLCGDVESEADWAGCANVGAVVLTGAGRAFSAGGDIKFLRDRAADLPNRNSVIMRRFYERFLSIRRVPVPTVAAVNGPAIGAGLCLALACDLRIAAREAKMGITFVGLGLHPGMGATHFLPRLVGPQIANRMMLTGEVLTGTDAERDGLVAAVSETGDDAVRDATLMASKIASNAPLAVRTCVRSLRMAHDDGLDRSLWREADAQAQVWNSADMTKGLDALEARARPEFADDAVHYTE